MTDITDEIRAFLRKPLPCVIGTLGNQGQPVTAATWYLLRNDDRIVLNIEAGRARIRHVDRDPRVALTVLGDDWYQHVSIQGRIVEMHEDADMAPMDEISRHYTGKDYPVRDKQRITMIMEIDRVFTWHVK